MHIAVTGASGLVGRMLAPALAAGGHRLTRLVRRPPGPGELEWNPPDRGPDPRGLSGVDAVVHLAGENLAQGRWTRERRRAILESRSTATSLLAQSIAGAPEGPRTLISASAVGYYGDRGEELLTEASPPGRGFLPDVVVAWEAATGPAEAAGIRVILLRTGLLLTPQGGLLHRMLLPFRLGVGGPLGSGAQWMSWIAADDLIGVILHGLTSDQLAGPVNAVAPEPVRNQEFTRILGRAVHRPAILPVPALALRMLFGQMADEAILASARVQPARLLEDGYRFRYPALGPALDHLLGDLR